MQIDPTLLVANQQRKLQDLCAEHSGLLDYEKLKKGEPMNDAQFAVVVAWAVKQGIPVSSFLIQAASGGAGSATGGNAGSTGTGGQTGGGNAQGNVTIPGARELRHLSKDEQVVFLGGCSKGSVVLIVVGIKGEPQKELYGRIVDIGPTKVTASLRVEVPNARDFVIRLPSESDKVVIVSLRLADEDLDALATHLMGISRAWVDPYNPATWGPYLRTPEGQLRWEDALTRMLGLPLSQAHQIGSKQGHQRAHLAGALRDLVSCAREFMEEGALTEIPPCLVEACRRHVDRAIVLHILDNGGDLEFYEEQVKSRSREEAHKAALERKKAKASKQQP